MMQRFFFFLVLGIGFLISVKAQDTSRFQISVLTCGPGTEVYEIFGHSAVRVLDKKTGNDIVYNYGTFDFNAPGFIPKFLRGQLDYFLNRNTIDSFVGSYQFQKRWVKEQVLNLDDHQKTELVKALEVNALAENRYYKYDFFFDNCVTRIRDLFNQDIGQVNYGNTFDSLYSFRDLLHSHLGSFPWTQFGMDLILGVTTDKVAGQQGQMFLPIYYLGYLGQAQLDNEQLLSQEKTLLDFPEEAVERSWFTPFNIFLLLLVIELIQFFLFYISGDTDFMKWLDRTWFFGLLCCFLIFAFMWFLTDHKVCSFNYNLVWTVPWSFFALFQNRKNKKLMFFLTILQLLFVLMVWMWMPQEMPKATLFIVLITLLKSLRQVGFNRWVNRIRKSGRITACILMCALSLPTIGQDKITGITVVAPPQPYRGDPMMKVAAVNAEWIALVPYGFSRQDQPEVHWGSDRQWWGERQEGIEASITLARKNGLKIMLKPQVWIAGGWIGNMDFDSEAEWTIWEDSYREYIMTFVDLAVLYDVELFCIGTEYKISVQKRESFWRALISDVRQKYKGKITYSSNWDSYDRIPIWDVLDYIGVSAYFPLSDMTTPMVMMLDYKWNKHVKKLRRLSEKFEKPILFTEYGYLSVDGAAGKTWELESKVKSLNVNEKAQANSYEALFAEFGSEDFWAGGFLWKWFPEGAGHEGYPERDYTPQDKKAEQVLSKWYGKLGN